MRSRLTVIIRNHLPEFIRVNQSSLKSRAGKPRLPYSVLFTLPAGKKKLGVFVSLLWRQSKVLPNVTWKVIKCPRRKSPSCFAWIALVFPPSSCFLIVKLIPLILWCMLALTKVSRNHISFQTSRQTCRDPLRRWPIERELPMEKILPGSGWSSCRWPQRLEIKRLPLVPRQFSEWMLQSDAGC